MGIPKLDNGLGGRKFPGSSGVICLRAASMDITVWDCILWILVIAAWSDYAAYGNWQKGRDRDYRTSNYGKGGR